MKTAPKRINAATFQANLDTLALTVAERLKDEWPLDLYRLPFAQGFFISSLRFCQCAYRAECEMYSDERREDYRWDWGKVVVLPPINRAVLDSLFNIIFMLEDIPSRSQWYVRSGWREQKLEYDRFLKEYSTNEEWSEWLPKLARMVQQGVSLFNITEDENENPKTIEQWPSSGQMPNYGINPPKRPANREFLQYLSDWFYREHSGMAHMSFLGMLKFTAVLNNDHLTKDERSKLEEDGLPQMMTGHVLRSAILLLCVISEIQSQFKFSGNIELRILDIWHILMQGSTEAKELFERRYSPMFPAFLVNLN
ncbi:MAG: hypothetical protein ABI380_14645 [Edaphobacter sp.]